MTSLCKPLNESTLNVNLNEVAHSLVRELAMACKKVGIYGAGHPSADRAVEKPFFVLDHIFGFKRYAGVNLQNGHLYILNIRVKESVFSAELIKYMQILDVRAILFERGVTMAELGAFIGRFVRRINTADHRNLLSSFLRDNVSSASASAMISSGWPISPPPTMGLLTSSVSTTIRKLSIM